MCGTTHWVGAQRGKYRDAENLVWSIPDKFVSKAYILGSDTIVNSPEHLLGPFRANPVSKSDLGGLKNQFIIAEYGRQLHLRSKLLSAMQ
jgi:hypothetical protein